jgi:hypothetical protein
VLSFRALLFLGPIALLSITCRSVAAPPDMSHRPDSLSLRVLVELRLDGGGAPTPERLAAARTELQSALRNADIPHEVVRAYDTIPWVALRIRPDDRERVERLPQVGAVRDDSPERLQEKAGS